MEDTAAITTTPSALLPSHDLGQFFRLDKRNQQRVRKMLAAFETIATAPTFMSGLAQAATAFGGERGFSAPRLREYYYEWKRAKRDWRVAINWAWEGRAEDSLPPEFINYVQQKVDAQKRSVEQALKQIRDSWKLGGAVPGYGTWREHWGNSNPGSPIPHYFPGFPPAWSVRNLRRKLDTSKFRRKVQTVGRTAAYAHRPGVITSRVGLWVASHIQFDDVEHDFFVNSLAEGQAGRPLELFSHDLYSARKIRWGIRVKTKNDDGTTNKLRGHMTRMIVAATLFHDGYSPRGTSLGFEHGTAACPEAVERALLEISGGLIRVERSGFTGAAGHAGQYPGISRGNPRFKASLESSNNLLHNVLAHLPGQTGPDIVRRPEQLHAMLEHNQLLLHAAQVMPPEVAANLILPILTTEQLHPILRYYYDYIDRDTAHELEGWEACGHVVQQIELAGRWLTQDELLALPPAQSQMALALLHQGQLNVKPRRMSRGEVWQRGCQDLIRIPAYGVCEILGDDFAREQKVLNHTFEFEDAEVGPGIHSYDAVATDPEGRSYELKEGETYQVFVNPFALDCLFVRDAAGRYIGTAPRIAAGTRGNYDSMVRAFGAAAKREARLLQPLRERQIKEVKARTAAARHNANLIEPPPTSEERAIIRRARAERGSLADLTGEAPTADLSGEAVEIDAGLMQDPCIDLANDQQDTAGTLADLYS